MTEEITGGKNKSDLILDEIMRRREEERAVDVEEKKVKVVVFSLHGDSYAFYGDCIKEILPFMPIYYVPGTSDFISGVINVRGAIESVIDINKFLDLPGPTASQNGRIALAVTGAMRSGILVDSIEDVLDIPVRSVGPPLDTLPATIKEFVAGGFMHLDKFVTILDISRIFGRIVA